MTKIKLSNGNHAFIDDEDHTLTIKFSWCESKRRTISYAYSYAGGGRKNRAMQYLHRLVMNAPLGVQVDHINGNGLDCQKSNLRFANHSQNRRNQRKTRLTTSQYKGVRYRKGGWEAFITIDHQYKYLGRFGCEADAARAYNAAAIRYFGEFSRVNIT